MTYLSCLIIAFVLDSICEILIGDVVGKNVFDTGYLPFIASFVESL